MDYLILLSIGLAMGLLGGLLGIGGSVVMIPAMVVAFGENQHLYQAAAMICNFFVAASSAVAHKKAEVLVWAVLKWLIPSAVVGVIAGVWASNLPVFRGPKSYRLAWLFGGFMVYVALFNIHKLYRSLRPTHEGVHQSQRQSRTVSVGIGVVTGLAAGLMGIGAGTVSTPLQQLLLRMPLKQAMSNSAVAIMGIAGVGAIYKNLSLATDIRPGLFGGDSPVVASLKIAAMVVPTGLVGGYIGGYLMHRLPKNLVRMAFIVVVILAAIKLLGVRPH